MVEYVLPTVLAVVLAIGAVILVVLIGWFVVWKMFLIRFSFIRELVYGSSNGNNNKKSTRKTLPPETPLRRSSRIRQRQETH